MFSDLVESAEICFNNEEDLQGQGFDSTDSRIMYAPISTLTLLEVTTMTVSLLEKCKPLEFSICV